MASKSPAVEVEVAGRPVRLSSPDKVCFPQQGYTKRDVFEYYLAVGDGILRALRERPTTLQRFPDGIEGEMFFQKRIPTRGRCGPPPPTSPTSCASTSTRNPAPTSAT